MANIAAQLENDQHNPGVRHIFWETLTSANTEGESDEAGKWLGMSAFADRSVQVDGTFDTGTLTMQGSNDGTSWYTLTDQVGADVSFTAAGMAMIAELTRYIRPSLGGAGGSADINVRLLLRSNSHKKQ